LPASDRLERSSALSFRLKFVPPHGVARFSQDVLVQFQHVTGNGLDQFKGLPHEKIVWPEAFKTGELIYP
jgi:hypothetical protein